MPDPSKICPCLWFDGEAEAAVQFYVALFANSSIDHVMRSSMDWPGGKTGDVLFITFTIAGQSYQALNGGPGETFNNSVSLSILCDDQEEVDRLWSSIEADGGAPVQCGWIKDRFGLSWQVVPKALIAMMQDDDTEKAQRVMAAMNSMVKLDIAALKSAFSGEGASRP